MDETRFDALTKTLGAAGSRRVALRTVVGSVVAIGLGRLGLDQTAAKRKKRKKKLKKNDFGCVNVGGKCRGKDANCCSGICQGKKPKQGKKDRSKCIAHNVLDCPTGADSCQQEVNCGPNGDMVCQQTTGKASFCGFYGACRECTRDAECEALGFGSGAACVVCAFCPQTGMTACAATID